MDFIADTVEQRATHEFRPDQSELALAQICKHLVVSYRLVFQLEKGHAVTVVFYPPIAPFDEQPYLFDVAATITLTHLRLPCTFCMMRTEVLPDLFSFFSTNMPQR